MCKRNYPDKNEAGTESVRDTPDIITRRQHGMCKKNSPHKSKASMGCVRQTSQINVNPAWDVSEKLPT